MSRLLPSAPGAPDPLVRQALRDAAIQFCEDTGVIRVTTDPEMTEVGVNSYDIDLPAETELSRVIAVWVGGRKFPTAPEVTVSDVAAFYPEHGATGHPYVVVGDGALVIVPAPAKSGQEIIVRASTRPTRTANKVDDQLFDKWGDAIVNGALFRLCSTPGQPFTDMVRAQQCGSMFYAMVGRAKIDANRGGVIGSISVKSRPFV